MRGRLDTALASQQSVWREHDANLARAWLLADATEERVIVLPEQVGHDDTIETSPRRVISLD